DGVPCGRDSTGGVGADGSSGRPGGGAGGPAAPGGGTSGFPDVLGVSTPSTFPSWSFGSFGSFFTVSVYTAEPTWPASETAVTFSSNSKCVMPRVFRTATPLFSRSFPSGQGSQSASFFPFSVVLRYQMVIGLDFRNLSVAR